LSYFLVGSHKPADAAYSEREEERESERKIQSD
jgi:hypothetical protein